MTYRFPTNQGKWSYEQYFSAPIGDASHPAIVQASDLVDNCGIADHPFFGVASSSQSVLRSWVSQELVVTNPFSQMLMQLANAIDNVHIRTMVMQVAFGEHGPLRGRLAPVAHPWLLHQLGISVGLEPKEILPFEETLLFLEEIGEACEASTLSAVGVLGMGSERLLVPEYTAIRTSFEQGWPDCDFKRFLNANIEEDVAHASLMELVAASLIEVGGNPDDFVDGARVGVSARMRYYSSLLERLQ
jgi:pyrroloquinoline quinone (PQQ) biosynthesis protein C